MNGFNRAFDQPVILFAHGKNGAGGKRLNGQLTFAQSRYRLSEALGLLIDAVAGRGK
jgi:hypothetical protein